MSFNKKVKEYFKSQGLSNRQVSEIMEGYSETMISKVLNKDDLSTAFLEKMLKYFPQLDYNYFLKEEEVLFQVNEEATVYKKRSEVLIEEKKRTRIVRFFFKSLLQFQFLLQKSLVLFRFLKSILLSECLNSNLIYLLHSILIFQSYPLKNSTENFVRLFFAQ